MLHLQHTDVRVRADELEVVRGEEHGHASGVEVPEQLEDALLGALVGAVMFWRNRQDDDEFLDEELE